MNLFRKKKKHEFKDDPFDRSLIHIDKDVPEDMKDFILDNYFITMLHKAFPNVNSDYDFGDASLIRIEANGKMHTRVILCNNVGAAEDAVDVDGRMGELLWALCRNREVEE